MARQKKQVEKRRLDVPFTTRLATEDMDRIDTLADHLPLTPSALAREALRLGLDMIEKDPGCLFKKKRRRK